MKKFSELRDLVNQTIESLPELKARPVELYEPVVYTMGFGGKRIRPVMVLMACQLFKKEVEAALLPAVGLEIFHNFTLLHDDVMDRADMRRGQPTVHKKWNSNVAILSGDAMFALASSLLCKAPAESLSAVMDSFNSLALGVCEGQQYDMNFETQAEVSMEEYMEMIRLKTAVLLAGALKIGAQMAGAPSDAVYALDEFGTKIGLAFQLQDDLLDLYADEAKFGKKIGSDIRENKKTYLYIKALELLRKESAGSSVAGSGCADASCKDEGVTDAARLNEGLADASRLEELFRIPTTAENEAEKIASVRALYEKVDVRSHLEAEVNRLFAEGESALARLSAYDIDPEALQVMQDFSAKLLGRDY